MTFTTDDPSSRTTAQAAEIVREYGPFAGTDKVAGVTHDGRSVWAATGTRLVAFDPASGEPTRNRVLVRRHGIAFIKQIGAAGFSVCAAGLDVVQSKLRLREARNLST